MICKHVESIFATWLGQHTAVIQHAFDKQHFAVSFYCTVHDDIELIYIFSS